MCARGKAQRISLWLDLFEWTESFLRNRLTNAVASPAGRRAHWTDCGAWKAAGSLRSSLQPQPPLVAEDCASHQFDQRTGGSIREKAASDSRWENVLRAHMRAQSNQGAGRRA